MKLKKRIIVLAVILGLLTVGVLYYYLESLKLVPEKKVELTEVVVAINTIPAHVKVSSEMVTIKSLPSEAVHPDAAINIEQVVGFTSKVEILNGEQFLRSRVATDESKSSLSYRIPENMRAITVPVSEFSSVGGYTIVGDKIDVLVSYNDVTINPTLITVTQFQNIEILEKGPLVPTSDDSVAMNQGVTSSLTLLVTPSQAEIMAYAIASGNIYMTLRNPVDVTISALTQFRAEEFSTWRER